MFFLITPPADPDARAGLAAIAPGLFEGAFPAPERTTFVAAGEKVHTVGAWGSFPA